MERDELGNFEVGNMGLSREASAKSRTFHDSPELRRPPDTRSAAENEFSLNRGNAPTSNALSAYTVPEKVWEQPCRTMPLVEIIEENPDPDTLRSNVTGALPTTFENPEVEVTHYPILQAQTPGGAVPEKNLQNVPFNIQKPQHPLPNSGEVKPVCQCACHHTHHHHHHHTIVINGKALQSLQEENVSSTVACSQGLSKPHVLKTASCPPWADGAPKQGRPIRNFNTNCNILTANCTTENDASVVYVGANATHATPNITIGGATNSGNNNNRLPEPGYRGPVGKRRKQCCVLTRGMAALIVVLVVVILSLLSGLIYFLVRGQHEKTESSDTQDASSLVPSVSIKLNQTSICGYYPVEYLPFAKRSFAPKVPAVNPYLPENDSRINKAGRIIGGMLANIVQYPWQGEQIDPTDSLSVSDAMTPKELVDSSKVEARILGGKDSIVSRFPWQVYLRGVSLWVEHRGMTCGGSIIMRDWILTAAHCTESNNDPAIWTAYVGMSLITAKSEPPAQSSKIIQIIQHEKYINDFSYDYDVSLMKLKTPLKYTPNVQPICLPSKSDEFKDGTPCWISGWGAMTNTGQGGSPTILQSAQVDIIGDATCTKDDWLGELVSDRMICAGKADGSRDACQGDSGGPLSCYDHKKQAWTLAGSVSWGIECGVAQQPGVYAKITFFVDWIWTKIGIAEGWIEAEQPAAEADKLSVTTDGDLSFPFEGSGSFK